MAAIAGAVVAIAGQLGRGKRVGRRPESSNCGAIRAAVVETAAWRVVATRSPKFDAIRTRCDLAICVFLLENGSTATRGGP